MMENLRRKTGLISILWVLLLCVGCTTGSDAVSEEESANVEAADDSDTEQTLDGSDQDAFDASWQTINQGLSEEERMRFNVIVLAAVISELTPETPGEEIDVASMLDALDGKTPRQLRVIAEEFIDGELDLEQLTPEEVQEISEEVEFDLKDEPTLTEIIELVEYDYGPREEPDIPPDQRFAATVASLSDIIQLYFMQHRELPEDLDQLTQGDPALIDEIPQDPWGNDYIYETDGDKSFSIISKGADGVRGTSEDLVVEY